MNVADKTFVRIPFEQLKERFRTVLLRYHFHPDKAEMCASIFAQNSLEGVYTHGVNRFPRFIQYIKDGYIKKDEEAKLVHSHYSIEQWDGRLGPGPINGTLCTNRAMEVAEQYGMGCVALSNTNHWMRGGYYGWQAAKKGFAFIGWTNTMANMPSWGARECKLGNNPLVIAMPYQETAIVLDMAMSQYSYGALDMYRTKNETLPVDGGYDEKGELTKDAAAIIQSRRSLPIGYWKGAGLSLLLDLLAAVLSGGLATAEISKQQAEYALSQVFIAIDLKKLNNYSAIEHTLRNIIEDYHGAEAIDDNTLRYPGENLDAIVRKNTTEGIPVALKVWKEIELL